MRFAVSFKGTQEKSYVKPTNLFKRAINSGFFQYLFTKQCKYLHELPFICPNIETRHPSSPYKQTLFPNFQYKYFLTQFLSNGGTYKEWI